MRTPSPLGGTPTHPKVPALRRYTPTRPLMVLKSVFHLSLRGTQGFVSSLLELLRLDLPVPDYSTLSRRQRSLATALTVGPTSRPRHIVVDATGLRVYGSGEWHVRKHRHGRRRVWRKLHLSVDETTKEIVAVEVTPSQVHDSRLLPTLLDQIPGCIVQVSGDGSKELLLMKLGCVSLSNSLTSRSSATPTSNRGSVSTSASR